MILKYDLAILGMTFPSHAYDILMSNTAWKMPFIIDISSDDSDRLAVTFTYESVLDDCAETSAFLEQALIVAVTAANIMASLHL